MVSLLRRRAMMVQAASPTPPLPEWDYEWSRTSGILPENDGWTKTIGTTGTASCGYEGSYYYNHAKTNGAYIQHAIPGQYSKGVLEVGFRISTNYGRFRLCLSNGSNALSVNASYSNNGTKGILLQDASLIADMTKLADFTKSETYYLRLVLNNGYGDVYVRNSTAVESDFTQVASNVDITTLQPITANTSFRFTATGSTEQTCNIYSIKMKFNRT